MKIQDKVRLSSHGEEVGQVVKVYDDGEANIKFPSGDEYVVPISALVLVESAPVVVVSPHREKAKRWTPDSEYKVGHNMRPYLAAAIYERNPDLRGVFTEKEKGNFDELQNARDWLDRHPAFLAMVRSYVVIRGIDRFNPIGIQLFVELYRWDESIQSAVLAAQSIAQAKKEQEETWQAEETAKITA